MIQASKVGICYAILVGLLCNFGKSGVYIRGVIQEVFCDDNPAWVSEDAPEVLCSFHSRDFSGGYRSLYRGSWSERRPPLG